MKKFTNSSCFLLLALALLLPNFIFGQRWVELMEDPNVNFYEVQNAFNEAWANQPYVRGKGWKQYKRWENFMEPRCFPHGKRPQPQQAWIEYMAFQEKQKALDNPTARPTSNWTNLGPDRWTNTTGWNPGNGRINAVAQHPTNASILFAGAPSGGLWKSTDAGITWACLTDNLPILGVSAIIIDPTNPNTMYIGTGDGDGSDTYSIGVLKSSDGGNSWQATGLSWLTTNSRTIRRMLMHPTNNQILFAATTAGLYRTLDGGANWNLVQTGSMRDVEFKPGDPNTVYACSNEVFRSTNGGASFTKILTGLPAAATVNRASIAVTAANPNYVYVLYGEAGSSGYYGLYRSNNSGTSFSLRSNSPNLFAYDTQGSGTGGQSWYDMALAISPTNAEMVFTGGINVWKSSDGGANWAALTGWTYPQTTLGYVHADIHTLDFFGNNLYCGSDGGLSRSSTAGTSWDFLSFGMEIMQFYRMGASAQNAYQIIGGTQDNGTNYLSNGTWKHVLGADGMEAAIDYSNSQIMYGETQNGGLNRSMNGGANWTDIEPSNAGSSAWVMPYLIDPTTPTILYAGYEEVWKSTNRGNSWNKISNFATSNTLRYLTVAPSNSNYIYTGTSSTLYYSNNAGSTWSTITPPVSSAISAIVVHPTNPQRIWVSLSGYNASQKVFYSPNAGQTWVNLTANLPNLPANCISYQTASPDGIYVGTDVGVYYTDSTLANWQPFMTGLPNVIVNELEIHYGVNKIRAATYGRGIWESDLYTPSSIPPIANFSYDTRIRCQGDSIQFTDISLNAAPGWQWLFPGGSPASSTLQSPKVLYTSPGQYSASLIVSNANGADTIVQNIQVDFASNQVRLSIRLDNYPEETSWEIVNGNQIIVATGGPYSAAGQTMNETICLPDGCYTFTIKDSYGDGICCTYGNGNYQLLDSANNVLASGGVFSSSESTVICFNATPPLSVVSSTATMASCGMNDGSITINASGGDGNYQYSIDAGTTFQSSNIFNTVGAGNYNIVVQDGLGASATSNISLSQRIGPTAVASSNSSLVYLNQGATVNFYSVLSSNATSFHWNFGDGTSSTQSFASHSYTAIGNYQVILTAYKEGCEDYDTLNIQVDLNSALSSTQNQLISIDALPNPFNNQLQLELFAPIKLEAELLIHNLLGQQVFWESLNFEGHLQSTINLANEPAGVYIVSLKTAHTTISKKLVKIGQR